MHAASPTTTTATGAAGSGPRRSGSTETKQPDWSHGPRDSGGAPRQTVAAVSVPVRPSTATATTGPVDRSGHAPGVVEDPFGPIRRTHAGLTRLLDEAEAGSGPARRRSLDALARLLRRHLDVTERVRYPMVRRHAGEAGGLAATIAEHRERRAAGLTRTGERDDRSLTELRREVDEHITVDDELVLPLLEATLDDDELAALGDAVREAHLTRPLP